MHCGLKVFYLYCLTLFLSFSKAFHSLVDLALEKGSAADSKDEAWGYYMDVIQVIEGAAKVGLNIRNWSLMRISTVR